MTDRCNLRCFYCMPEEGIDYVDRKDLLSYEEMLDIVHFLVKLGLKKVRITGGEPFVRKGLIDFLGKLCAVNGLDEVHITTNGTLTLPYIPELKKMGISGVNLSLDSLDRWRFESITRRDKLPDVMESLNALVKEGIPTRINTVVMEGRNTEDIIALAELSKEMPLGVRFIEEMPFNGTGRQPSLHWDFQKIFDELKNSYPDIQAIAPDQNGTAKKYRIPGFKGEIGIIPAFSRTFCGTCNRIRLTPQGDLRTCLYGPPKLQVRDMMRNSTDKEEWRTKMMAVFTSRAKDGFESEKEMLAHKKNRVNESMSSIGG